MQTDQYRGYTLWGHAILQQEDVARPGQIAGSGTIMRGSQVVVASGVLDLFDSDEEAESAGLSWCRAWVDNHG